MNKADLALVATLAAPALSHRAAREVVDAIFSEIAGAVTHGERVIMSIEDSGEGIAYGQQGRIFEPFVQVGRKKGGAGLGLALCKEIVQLHGGRIGVYSRPGQGTQFYMALPL